jgi:isoamylase
MTLMTYTFDPATARLEAGEPRPFGATWTGTGVNFAVFASQAERVELCIFDAAGEHEVARIALPERTEGIWHGFLSAPNGPPGLVYGYRVYGPFNPEQGRRYNGHKLLLDPYARALAGKFTWNDALHGSQVNDDEPETIETTDSAPYNYKARVIDGVFDWQFDRPPAVPWRDSVIYELHIKGFTKLHPEVPERERGTYLGLAHPSVIQHLRRLGVTAVEIMPAQGFVPERFLVERGLKNYWGYSSLAWFAPAPDYAIEDPVVEFKTMVRALHAAGIEVILDVVFNHTVEGNERGPTLSLRGFDNEAYYRLEPHSPGHYADRTGTGNTIAIGHPAARDLVIDSLRYWAEEMHVDGFRFDLAAVLGRDDGRFRTDGTFFKALSAEPTLRYVKLIAEPWDVGSEGYQLGHFPSGWSEWNDLYRDTMRSFWRGNPGILGNFAERFAGSSDLFRATGRRPTASVNFIACHDGFTLHDSVAYNDKHNERNLEENRDGHNHNLSWNCGVEGATDDTAILELRERQTRNFLATLLLSQGVPMLLAGDEFGRTQLGNNNAYCQDNEISWVDWQLAGRRKWLIDFVRQLIALRKQAPGLRRDTFLKGARQADRQHKDVTWRHPLGHELNDADWHNGEARTIAVLIGHAFTDPDGNPNGHLLFLCNTSDESVDFRLPEAKTSLVWQTVFDTSRWRANDLGTHLSAGGTYTLIPHSCALLADGNAPHGVRAGFTPGS